MTGKALELENILNQETLARDISNKYSQWYNARQEREAEWLELRNYVFATDTTKTTNNQLPWKNKTTLPKICQIRDNLHANYMAALFPNDDWLAWEAYTQDALDKDKAKYILAYMKNKLREGDFMETVSKLLYDYIDYGNVIADTEYVNESKFDEAEQKEIPGFVGPRAIRISPLDHLFNPLSSSYKESPKITRMLKSIGELAEEIEEKPELGYQKAVFDLMISKRNQLRGSYDNADWNKAQSYIVDGFGSLMDYYGSDYVELLEFEGTLFDTTTNTLYKDYVITIADRQHVIRKEKSKHWYKGSSKVHAGWRLRPGNLWAMGPLDNLVGMQYRIDHLENLKADQFDLIAHPPLVIKGQVEDFEWGPNAEIRLPEDGQVDMLRMDATALNADLQIQNLMAIMEEMAGAPKQAMGIRTPGEKTAFEVQTLQNAAGRIFQHKIAQFEQQVIEPLLNNMLEQAVRNLDTYDIVRVMDDDYGAIEFAKITKEDITAKGKIRPVGARHYAMQAQLIQNLNGVFNSAIGQTIAPHVSAKRLAKLIEQVLDLEKFSLIQDNIRILENAESQRLVNAAQDTVDTESITPTENL